MAFDPLPTSLAILRLVRGLSQDELAQLTGVRASSISDYERGRIVPGLRTLRQLLDGLRFPLFALDRAEGLLRELEALGVESAALPHERVEPPSTIEAEESWRIGQGQMNLRAEIESLATDLGRAAMHFVRLLLLLLARLEPRSLGSLPESASTKPQALLPSVDSEAQAPPASEDAP